MYLSVGRYPVRIDPQYRGDKMNKSADRCENDDNWASGPAILKGRVSPDLVRERGTKRAERKTRPGHETVADTLGIHRRGTQ